MLRVVIIRVAAINHKTSNLSCLLFKFLPLIQGISVGNDNFHQICRSYRETICRCGDGNYDNVRTLLDSFDDAGQERTVRARGRNESGAVICNIFDRLGYHKYISGSLSRFVLLALSSGKALLLLSWSTHSRYDERYPFSIPSSGTQICKILSNSLNRPSLGLPWR